MRHDADVIVVGAGPAGAVAATVLARAGARVRLLDRARFPRHKLCGDTVNPGTLALMRRLGVAADVERRSLRIVGMRVTGGQGQSIEARYPDGLYGLAIERRHLDWLLLQDALGAGAEFEDAAIVRQAVVSAHAGRPRVAGVRIAGNGRADRALSAPVVVAADGRRSALAFGLGLARHPTAPRRWAVGAYFAAGAPAGVVGEMHLRGGHYIGVAPLPGGLTNMCLVQPSRPADPGLRRPAGLLARVIAREADLRDRFDGLEPLGPPVVLGPLAVDAAGSIDGLVLAGDAAGFVDPMTGDGLRFAIGGGHLAAQAALHALAHGWTDVHARLAQARLREFGAKWRFNRCLRAVSGSPIALHGAAAAARVLPAFVRAAIIRAGDCALGASA